MAFLVTKPQFDPEELKSGKALRVKITRSHSVPEGWYGFDRSALVVRCSPLELQLVYIKEKGDSWETKTLPIDIVANGTIQITPLTEEFVQTKGEPTI
jgi:hypothetical protein